MCIGCMTGCAVDPTGALLVVAAMERGGGEHSSERTTHYTATLSGGEFEGMVRGRNMSYKIRLPEKNVKCSADSDQPC